MNLEHLTAVIGVDAQHLQELLVVWQGWTVHKPELLQMRLVVFYDIESVSPAELDFLSVHPRLKLVPWALECALSQREKMLTGFVHVPAQHVETPWYVKIDTDVVATGGGVWIEDEWFKPGPAGDEPVFVTSPWGYSKPRYAMDLLDDWADRVPAFAGTKRLDIPYSSTDNKAHHARIISWVFFGRTDWTRRMSALCGKSGRLPLPSQDSFLFYCAERLGLHYVRVRMSRHGWSHQRIGKIERGIREAGESGVQPMTRKEEARGVIYYNTGTGCLVRLLVSLFSLRQHYAGPVTFLSEGAESHKIASLIAAQVGAEVVEWDCGVAEGPNRAYLAKTRYHLGSPYETTVALDSDTLVTGPVDELFDLAEEHEFCVAQLANWRSDGSVIRARLRQWEGLYPELVRGALKFGPAINCGVVAFTKGALILQAWHDFAVTGRDFFIPDEVGCQILLQKFPHLILPGKWNCSCRYGHGDDPDTRVIHYHGKKHCRKGLPYHGDKWMRTFEKLRAENVAQVRAWMPAGDRMLKRYLREDAPAHAAAAVPAPRRLPLGLEGSVRVIIGARKTKYEGWHATQRDDLDVTREEDFAELLGERLADRFLAEHVWEHLTDEDLIKANALTYKYLRTGGCLRIAVPDGFHPDAKYVQEVMPNGTGRSAHDHKQLFDHHTLSAALEAAGFQVTKLEYWDENGTFHQSDWSSHDGHIKRSARFDRRNRARPLSYTSLIVDAVKV